jgi:hypothetical protein
VPGKKWELASIAKARAEAAARPTSELGEEWAPLPETYVLAIPRGGDVPDE